MTIRKSSGPRVTQEKSLVPGRLGRKVRSEGDCKEEFRSEGVRREEFGARDTQGKSNSPE